MKNLSEIADKLFIDTDEITELRNKINELQNKANFLKMRIRLYVKLKMIS